MGMNMVKPGVYDSDPAFPGEDFEKYQTLVKISRLPDDSRHTKRLHNFEAIKGREEGLQAAIDFINGKITPPLLLLYGETGRSKTHLALAIGWVFIARLRSVLYYEVVELLDNLRAGYRIQVQPGEYNADTHEAIMQRLKEYQLLILDDLGVEKSTDWAAERLDHIVNYRYVNNKPTVITSNVLDISERILGRCKEGKVVLLKGEDYRDIIRRRKEKSGHTVTKA